MDVSKLEPGMEFKNYKLLCEFIGDKVSAGNTKKYQLIDWDRYFTYEKKGHKFIIKEVYEESLDKTTGRGLHNALPFLDEMELLLIDTIVKCSQDEFIISNSKLMLQLCMVNPNYHKYFSDRERLSSLLDIDIDYVMDFYDTTNATFKGAIETVNNRLEAKMLTMHYVTHMIEIEDDNNLVTYREATKDEAASILNIQRNILEYKYNCNSIQDIFSQGKALLYYKDVSSKLKEAMNINKVYKAHKYVYNVDQLIKQKVRILNANQIDQLEYELNLKVRLRINDNAVKRYNDTVNKMIDNTSIKIKDYRINEDYVDGINTLSNSLIDKDNDDSINNSVSIDDLLI